MAHFTVRDGIERGLTKGRMRGHEFEHPYWGVRSDVVVDTVLERVRAFVPRLPDRGFYFGFTAAMLHGIPLPARAASVNLHIGVRAGDRRIDCSGVTAHHVILGDADLMSVNGLPATSPARTWYDLAASGLHRPELVAAGDRLLWRRDPLTSENDIRAALARYEGRRGSRLLRDALPMLSSRSDSAPESELRVAVIDAGLPHPEVNAEVVDDRGRFLASPDLIWRSAKVALEYEGDHHRTDRDQWHRDLERYSRLQENGWIVLRASAADYRDPSALIARLARLLRARLRESTDFG